MVQWNIFSFILNFTGWNNDDSWWCHQIETFSALLALCEGNPPGGSPVPSQRPVTRKFDVFFDQRLNKCLSKQLRRRWFETPWRSLWPHCNVFIKSITLGGTRIYPQPCMQTSWHLAKPVHQQTWWLKQRCVFYRVSVFSIDFGWNFRADDVIQNGRWNLINSRGDLRAISQ